MKGAGYFRLVALAPNHTPRQSCLLAVWAFIVGGIPFAPTSVVKNSNLPIFDQDTSPAIGRDIRDMASQMPRYFFSFNYD
ncbi:hypothetical protein BN8_02725 [Fibrisoma limi BUZ 3]|uniref:Uncharacterized protein n=1 Tax=Fibrisoma limi BUZ 3 TaxID=1185876 RepID=I2GI92_9BACT|nr:hypothetical protein BN8_02725 [Fibrisoma limi BUZ 3]